MIRLKNITIHGFKSLERTVFIEFPETPLSVIYGNNGCGKTTLLKIIFALFSKDELILKKENVELIQFEVIDKETKEIKKGTVILNYGNSSYDWSNFNQLELSTSSILFGVNRGMILDRFELSKDEIDRFLFKNGYNLYLDNSKDEFIDKLYDFIRKKSDEHLDSNNFDYATSRYQNPHIYLDKLEIEIIKAILLYHNTQKENKLDTLTSIYNSYIQEGKELVITENEAFIKIGSNQHKLDQLSSGERHLLSFLTMFILEGKNRDFLLIDEPEVSLDTRWQRKIMDIFIQVCPNSQIIVASHSPSIGYPDTDNIVKMK